MGIDNEQSILVSIQKPIKKSINREWDTGEHSCFSYFGINVKNQQKKNKM